MILIIEVTQEDIDNGKCHDPYKCVIALALGRALYKANLTHIRLVRMSRLIALHNTNIPKAEGEIPGATNVRIRATPYMIKFMDDFDRFGAKSVSPCVFELPIPDRAFDPVSAA